MYFTAFFPFCDRVSIRYSWPKSMGYCNCCIVVFQAASPVLLAVGGVRSVCARILLAAGCFHRSCEHAQKGVPIGPNRRIPPDIWILLYFLVIVAGGLFFYLVYFKNHVNVLPPRGGLDSGFCNPLEGICF